MWLLQTRALLVEAYRELNAKKLFWAVMAISGLITVSLACVGLDEQGISLLGFHFDNQFFNTNTMPREEFYKAMFIGLGLRIWITWGATILAIISTAGMIPDFLAGGAIENTLSKPIGRVRLFLTKYSSGLLFVFLQTLVFSLGAFLIIGLRSGTWEPGLFLAVPLVTLFYSYLFCVCALVGLLTRSTIAALMATLLFWLLLFALNSADAMLLIFKKAEDVTVDRHEQRIALLETRKQESDTLIDAYRAAMTELGLWSDAPPTVEPEPDDASTAAPAPTDLWLPDAPPDNTELRRMKRDALAAHERYRSSERYVDNTVRPGLEEHTKKKRILTTVHRSVFAAKSILPKTSETMNLLTRWVTEAASLSNHPETDNAETSAIDPGARALFSGSPPPTSLVATPDSPEVQQAVNQELTSRTATWIIGTSLLFELVILAIACFLFAKRDF